MASFLLLLIGFGFSYSFRANFRATLFLNKALNQLENERKLLKSLHYSFFPKAIANKCISRYEGMDSDNTDLSECMIGTYKDIGIAILSLGGIDEQPPEVTLAMIGRFSLGVEKNAQKSKMFKVSQFGDIFICSTFSSCSPQEAIKNLCSFSVEMHRGMSEISGFIPGIKPNLKIALSFGEVSFFLKESLPPIYEAIGEAICDASSILRLAKNENRSFTLSSPEVFRLINEKKSSDNPRLPYFFAAYVSGQTQQKRGRSRQPFSMSCSKLLSDEDWETSHHVLRSSSTLEDHNISPSAYILEYTTSNVSQGKRKKPLKLLSSSLLDQDDASSETSKALSHFSNSEPQMTVSPTLPSPQLPTTQIGGKRAFRIISSGRASLATSLRSEVPVPQTKIISQACIRVNGSLMSAKGKKNSVSPKIPSGRVSSGSSNGLEKTQITEEPKQNDKRVSLGIQDSFTRAVSPKLIQSIEAIESLAKGNYPQNHIDPRTVEERIPNNETNDPAQLLEKITIKNLLETKTTLEVPKMPPHHLLLAFKSFDLEKQYFSFLSHTNIFSRFSFATVIVFHLIYFFTSLNSTKNMRVPLNLALVCLYGVMGLFSLTKFFSNFIHTITVFTSLSLAVNFICVFMYYVDSWFDPFFTAMLGSFMWLHFSKIPFFYTLLNNMLLSVALTPCAIGVGSHPHYPIFSILLPCVMLFFFSFAHFRQEVVTRITFWALELANEKKEECEDFSRDNKALFKWLVPPHAVQSLYSINANSEFHEVFSESTAIAIHFSGMVCKKIIPFLREFHDLIDEIFTASSSNFIERVWTRTDKLFAVSLGQSEKGKSSPIPSPSLHCIRAVNFALKMADLFDKRINEKTSNLNELLKGIRLSIFIHSGKMNCGLCRESSFSYQVWGKAVNELLSLPLTDPILSDGIFVTEAASKFLHDKFPFSYVNGISSTLPLLKIQKTQL
eukprot:TRINITY_DN9801_c0_g2_i1.p1 TRINITY_DN9801_c0_g2~~TRINITY_DN9801_c0_g2_i1.p1  ORF type:complete len:1035 (+),score=236.23 TRINITY_DN9801_c0_g2_i1:252-3107(+)